MATDRALPTVGSTFKATRAWLIDAFADDGIEISELRIGDEEEGNHILFAEPVEDGDRYSVIDFESGSAIRIKFVKECRDPSQCVEEHRAPRRGTVSDIREWIINGTIPPQGDDG